MRICIVGGIFDKPADYRDRHSISPETVLADGLRQRGWQVTLSGHAASLPQGNFDLVHVHHFGRAALRLAAATGRPPFVLTTHDPFAMNGLPVGWRRRLTDGFVLRKAAAIVALSNAERDFLARRRGLPPERVAVIPNGISTAVFDRTATCYTLCPQSAPPIRASNCGWSTRLARYWSVTRGTRRGSGWTAVWSSPGPKQPPAWPGFIPPPPSSSRPVWVNACPRWSSKPCPAAPPW
jgi:hypothetical protein